MRKLVDQFIREFGFDGWGDYIDSSFQWMINQKILLLSIGLGSVGAYLEEYLGLEPVVYLAFIGLLVMEFWSGIKASIKEGKKIQSNKLQRVILKMLTYTTLIGIMHIFNTRLNTPNIFGLKIKIFSFIYYTTINLVVVQLIVSVLENLSRLGYSETSKIFKIISSKINKWTDIK